MDSLAKKLTRREVRAALGSLPKELDETYDQAMQRIQNQDEGQTNLAHKVLYWISCSLRPLTVIELQQALAVELGDEDLDEDGLYETELMVSVCAGLVTLDEESNQIRLVHYTTQSYFKRIGIARLSGTSSTIAKTCLTYLAFRPFADKYCSNEKEFRDRLEKYPFLGYAASYWGDHARDGMDDDVRGLALEYLSNSISILSATQIADRAKDPFALSTGYAGRVPNLTRLHGIASFGLVDIAHDLMADAVDVNSGANSSITPLHLAASAGHTQMVRLLLQAGADVSSRTFDGQTPLQMAAKEGHESVVQVLIDAGAGYCDPQFIGWNSPLHSAVRQGHIDVVRLLIEKGANVNQKDTILRMPKSTDKESSPELDAVNTSDNGTGNNNENSDDDDFEYVESGMTPLIRAVRQGHVALVLLLLNNGADIGATDYGGQTALHIAAYDGHIQLVELLIARGIDISTVDTSYRTVLHCASQQGRAEVVQMLLEKNANVLAEDLSGSTAVHEAVACGHENVLKMLLEHIGKGNETGRWLATTRLRSAVDQADEDEVLSVLEKGADPNCNSTQNIPLLHIVVVRENTKVLQLLLANGASVDIKESWGRTALHWAAHRDYSTGIQILLDHDADIQTADKYGITPLHMAAGFGCALVVKQLLDRGAKLDTKDKDQKTPLSYLLDPTLPGFYGLMLRDYGRLRVTQEGEGEEDRQIKRDKEEKIEKERLAVLDLLIEKGADLNESHPHARTTLLQAIRPNDGRPKAALMRRLLEKGADITAQDDDGCDALFYATCSHRLEVVQLLLEYGADVNRIYRRSKFRNGGTALHEAARIGLADIACLLVEAGVDVNAVNEDGATALHEAVSAGVDSIAVIDLLLSHGVDINAHYGDKNATVIHHAILQNNVIIVGYLLEKGASITATDINGKTALDLANDIGHEAMLFFLGRDNT